jgi:hypothetical protein
VPSVQVLLVLSAATASIVLRRGVPVLPNTSAYDGMLFARLAGSMRAGDWLGPFDQLTLAKGPGYPFFLAVTSWSGLELKVAEQLVHLVACAAVALVVLVTTRRRWAAVVGFVLLALDPANFGVNSVDVMRENLFASLGVLALALAFLTVLGVVRRSRWAWIVLGAVATGTVVAGYWITREEGVTVLPSLAVVLLGVPLAAVLQARRAARDAPVEEAGPSLAPSSRRPALLRGAVALLLLGLTAILPLAAITSLNDNRYGAAVLNDQGEGTFLRAYADWSRVEAGPRLPRIPISEEQREAVYEVSTAARQLRPTLEDPDNQWRYFGCAEPETTVCDYGGGWMVWALREAAVEAGRFDDAAEGQEFFARLSAQITAACDEGRLECAPALPASLQGLQRAPAGDLARNALLLLWDMVSPGRLYETPGPGLAEAIPEEVRALYAPVVRELPLTVRAGEEELAAFQDRRPLYGALGAGYAVLVPVLTLAGIAGLVLHLVRAVRGRQRVRYLPLLALALAVGVVVRAVLLAIIETADFTVVDRYLLPGYAMLLAFGVVGAACGLAPRADGARPRTPASGEVRPGWELGRVRPPRWRRRSPDPLPSD